MVCHPERGAIDVYLSLVDQPQIEIGHHSSITIGGFILYTDTLLMTALVLAIIGALVYLARRKGITEDAPTGVQNVLEMAIEFVSGLVEDTIGENGRRVAPMVVTMFLFILLSNWLGLVLLPGLHLMSPTADLNSTLALALVTFVMIHVLAFQTRGFAGYFKHYLEPYPIFAPITLIEELSKPLTLSFRLFGNILAGEVMLVVLLFFGGGFMLAVGQILNGLTFGHVVLSTLGLVGLLIDFGATVLWIGFSIFIGAIQAFIFTMLTIAYFGQAMEHHEAGQPTET
jgi:F-type H+-transporting ATPase subunit a